MCVLMMGATIVFVRGWHATVACVTNMLSRVTIVQDIFALSIFLSISVTCIWPKFNPPQSGGIFIAC